MGRQRVRGENQQPLSWLAIEEAIKHLKQDVNSKGKGTSCAREHESSRDETDALHSRASEEKDIQEKNLKDKNTRSLTTDYQRWILIYRKIHVFLSIHAAEDPDPAELSLNFTVQMPHFTRDRSVSVSSIVS